MGKGEDGEGGDWEKKERGLHGGMGSRESIESV